MPAKRSKASATVMRSGVAKGSATCARKLSLRGAGGLGGDAQHFRAILHQPLVGLIRAIPLEHGEGRVMQGPALAVAIGLGEREDLRLARRQQLLARELRGGVQIERPPRSIRADQLGSEGGEVRLVAGRHLQGAGLDLDEPLRLEPGAQRGPDAAARQQERPAVRVIIGVPPGAWLPRHEQGGRWQGLDAPWRCRQRPVESGQLIWRACRRCRREQGSCPSQMRAPLRCRSDRRW